MNVIPVCIQSEEGKKVKNPLIPVSLRTVYAWSSKTKFPNLIIKVGGLLFWDQDAWEGILKSKQKEQLKKAQRLNS